MPTERTTFSVDEPRKVVRHDAEKPSSSVQTSSIASSTHNTKLSHEETRDDAEHRDDYRP
jgi:hypothetical protein